METNHTESLAHARARWSEWQCTTCGPSTIRQRADVVERVRERAALVRDLPDFDPRDLTVEDVAAYLARAHLGPNSRATYYRALTSWFGWLHRTGRITVDPMVELRRPRGRQGIPNPLTSAELEAVFAGAQPATRAMMSLALYAGLRCAEVASFRGDQIRGAHLVVTGKGDKPARLPLARELGELALFMPRAWWFPSPRTWREHLAPEYVSTLVAERFREAGIPHGSIHRLRHTYGTLVHRRGGNLRVTQQLLRHASPVTTAIYTLVDDDQMSGALEGLPRMSA